MSTPVPHSPAPPLGRRRWIAIGTRHLAGPAAFAIAMALGHPPLAAQDSAVAGVVLGTGGSVPLEGARVTIEGTQLLQTTGANGRFRFENLPGAEVTLRVARVGYRPGTLVARAGNTDLRIVLREASVQLDEIVVTGQPDATERRAIGNSIATIDAPAALELSGSGDISKLINGRAPGVTILPSSGRPGAGPTVTVRGVGTLSLNSQPLLYIDGVRVTNDAATGPNVQGGLVASRLNDIAPEDIESIEVIKGPAASTIYGTEAANGVIQVITKKGRVGKPQVNLTVKQGSTWLQDPEGRFPTNYALDETGGLLSWNGVEQENARGTPIWTNGHTQSYTLSVNGGSSALQYYLSGTYDNDQGIEPINKAGRFAGHANLSFPINDNLDIRTSLNYVNGKTHFGLDYTPASSTFGTLNGSPLSVGTPTRGFFLAPPEVWYSGVFDNTQDLSRFTGSVTVNHRPLSWLSHRLIVGMDQTGEDNQGLVQFMPPRVAQFFDPVTARGSFTQVRRDIDFFTGDYSATARFDLSRRISSATSIGAQYYQRQVDSIGVTGQQFPAPGLTTGVSTATTLGAQDFVNNKTIGLFAQQQFGLNDRAFLTGAIRIDNNSAFGDNFDLATYPKVSGTWVVSEEPFWPLGFMDVLKLRAAYGASGQQPESFSALRSYAPTTGPNDAPVVTPQFVGNPDLKPERGEEFEIGFEAGLFERIGIDFTVFSKQTRDAILLRPSPPSGGFPGAQFVNIGAVSNKGIELQVNAQVIRTPDFGWDLSASVATASNYIKDLGGIPGTGLFNSNVEGYPIASYFIKKVVSAEVDANGVVTSALCDGGPGSGPVDCATAPLVFGGTPVPKATGAFTSTVTLFKNFRLYGLVDFKRGHRRFAADRWIRCTIFLVCLENWRPQGVDPTLLADIEAAELQTINSFVEDAGFFKLREISASYTLPDRWARSFGASRATITVSGRNLHTWTDFTGLDPESESTPGGADDFFQQAVTPTLAQFITAVSLSF